jgi:hypothetical protein
MVLPPVAVVLLLAGCGTATSPPKHSTHTLAGERRASGIAGLLAGVRPIGRGPRFQQPAGERVLGACRTPLGTRRQAHIELFGANRVVLLASGIGTRAPRRIRDGRLRGARCFGALVTLDPTGTVYYRPGRAFTVADIFRVWGQPLTGRRIASFSGTRVRVYVNGRRWHGSPGAVPLTQDAEIVLEVGPQVPPHAHFSFAPQPAPGPR